MTDYLDISKSVMISAPAGSGKTERLARRYIALLQDGVNVERILAITFTDKASAEMKQRILRILKEEDAKLFQHLIERMPLMRVSTIHSFCGTMLRRFSFEAAIDPNYTVEDAITSRMEWEDILYETLMEAGSQQGTSLQENEFILQTLSEKGFRGLDYLKNTVDYLYQKRPFSVEAEIFAPSPHCTASLIEELRSWHGVKDVIENYERFFEEGNSDDTAALEKYFLTEKKEPRKRPHPSLKHIIDHQDWAFKMHMYWKDRKAGEYAQRSERTRKIFNKCLHKYAEKKKAKRSLDFSDLEYLSYRMLTDHPEWANILYAFDEKTDHILVDEFQDTNNFQWGIINKLTEEWRSGMGPKREEGTRPTVFFVGDEKQSIYFFRGANVEIFHRAKEQLTTWLADEFHYEEAKENYRSLPAIIEFTNHVFSKIMDAGPGRPPWITRYSPFSAHRAGIHGAAGKVEIILLDGDAIENTQEAKQKEAEMLAKRIQGFAGNVQVTDKQTQQQRPCRYMDIAILLRKRTHLKKYEEALANYNIPFVAVKGIGFYQEPEVAMLRAFVFFLSNPHDDYSLYVLLKSPIFNIDESAILELTGNEGESLFLKMQNIPDGPDSSNGLNSSLTFLQDWLLQVQYTPVAELIEHALVRTKAWRYFHEDQKRANIKKFIRIVEDLEANGRSLIKMRDFLERTLNKEEEPKANVNTEGMDAVKIMTIHAAKGLEFPVVFVPGIEEPFKATSSDNLVFEKEGRFIYKSVPEASIRRQDEDFLVQQAKEEEEQKRLFYVAATRAGEALVLTGSWDNKGKGFLGFLKHGLGLVKEGPVVTMESGIPGVTLLTEEDVSMLYEHAHKHKAIEKEQRHIEVIPLIIKKQPPWRPVTETVDIRRRHGKDWLMLGDIMHRIFEGISKGLLQEHGVSAMAEKLLLSKGIKEGQTEEKIAIIEKDIATLKQKGVWQDIILPRADSFTELPFIFGAEDTVYNGRIDRIIKEEDTYKIYDYKTFPVKKEEVEYLLREYSFQLAIYRKAVKQLFNTKNVKSFIVFTHTGDVEPV